MINDNIVASALEYYDRLNEKHSKLFSKINISNFQIDRVKHDLESNTITYFDDDKNVIFRTHFEAVGLYSNKYKLWNWSWSNVILGKNETYIAKKILNYGLDLDSNYFLKAELVTSRFRVTNKIQLDLHVAIASYLSKKVIFKYRYYKDKVDKDNKNYTDFYIFILDAIPEIK